MAERSLLLTEYIVRGCCSLRDRFTEEQSPNVLSKVVPQEIEHQGPENVCLELIHINSAHISPATGWEADSLPPIVATGFHSTSLACNHSGTCIFWSLPIPNHLPLPTFISFWGGDTLPLLVQVRLMTSLKPQCGHGPDSWLLRDTVLGSGSNLLADRQP